MTERRYPDGLGFTWGDTESVVWIAGPDSSYKRIDPELLAVLRDLANGDRRFETLEDEVREAVAHLESEGYLEPGGEVEYHDPGDGIGLRTRLGVFVVASVALTAFVAARLTGLSPMPAITSGTPLSNTVLAMGLLSGLAICHELGHYAAARPYIDPGFSVSRLNGVFPALITETNDAWRCHRSVRIWINMAGPLVDALLTLGLVGVHLLVFPESGVLATVIIFESIRLFFSLNPLVQGDGYWMLVDLFGAVNLRTRGFEDLKSRRLTKPSAYALASSLATVVIGLLMVRFLLTIALSLL